MTAATQPRHPLGRPNLAKQATPTNQSSNPKTHHLSVVPRSLHLRRNPFAPPSPHLNLPPTETQIPTRSKSPSPSITKIATTPSPTRAIPSPEIKTSTNPATNSTTPSFFSHNSATLLPYFFLFIINIFLIINFYFFL